MKFHHALLFALTIPACTGTGAGSKATQDRFSSLAVETSEEAAKQYTSFPSYWGRGLAELNRYEVKKGRYSEQHEGEAVFVFVTEDFDTVKQVKSDTGRDEGATTVLKLNAYERFYTGIYPYTILSSIFSPTSEALAQNEPYKIMATVQEWCGATWLQLNKNEEGYAGKGMSYFQSQGDRTFQLAKGHYEDSVWNTIRLNPASLPTGKIEMVPPMAFASLMHIEIKAYEVQASLKENQDSPYSDKKLSVYHLSYPALQRTMAFHFETVFPHRIFGYEETKKSFKGQVLKTTGRLTHSIMLDYWNKHNQIDGAYRDALGLQY